jgi:hypothetical protein
LKAGRLFGGGCLLLWLAALPALGLPVKNGQLPQEILPQTRARPAMEADRLYLGMREADFAAYTRVHAWSALEQSAHLQRKAAMAMLYLPGGEALHLPDGPAVTAQGTFVRAFFERGRLSGLQLFPNFGEGGLTLKDLQRLGRAWFPDERLQLRYQMLPEDATQQVVEAILGRIPTVFTDLTGRTSLPFQSLVLGP